MMMIMMFGIFYHTLQVMCVTVVQINIEHLLKAWFSMYLVRPAPSYYYIHSRVYTHPRPCPASPFYPLKTGTN